MKNLPFRAQHDVPGGARWRLPRLSLARPSRGTAQQNIVAYLFLTPWLLGLFILTLGPMVASLYLSFTDFDLFTSPSWIGLENYRWMLFEDRRYLQSVQVTFTYVLVSVPFKLMFALAVAMILNRGLLGISLYRAIYFLPSLLGGSVAIAIMWRQIFSTDGVVNYLLGLVGIKGESWISDPDYALYTLVILAVWQFGSPMVIFLAGLRQIPRDLYDASAVDGAGKLSQFFRITIPLLTPIIFFNFLMQMIGSFQFQEAVRDITAFLEYAGEPIAYAGRQRSSQRWRPLLRCVEPVADPAHRTDQSGRGRHVLHLRPQALHTGVHEPRAVKLWCFLRAMLMTFCRWRSGHSAKRRAQSCA